MTSLSAVTLSEAPAGVLVLDGVPCSCWHPTDEECAACPGQFPPRVSVGQRIAVVRPCEACGGDGVDHEVVGVMDDGTEVEVNCEVCDGEGWLLVGTVTATTEALPIVDDPDEAWQRAPALLYVDEDELHLVEPGRGWNSEAGNLYRSSLPDDLVGRWAVLVDDLTPTTERCPRPECASGWAQASFLASQAAACPVCQGEAVCPPVPVGDVGPAGTVVEVEL